MERRASIWALCILLSTFSGASSKSNETSNVVYLARGRRGVVPPFPPIPSLEFTPENTSPYLPRYSPARHLLFCFFIGSIAPQNGIPEGVYDTNEDSSLVIENVTDSNEGNYYCKIKPIDESFIDAGVVTVKVIDFITQTTLYLERGVQGVVPCPASSEIELTPDDIKTVHWYDTPLLDGTPSMISDFNNKIKFLGPGVPPGMYDIDEDFNLVITKALDSSVKTYYYRLYLNGRPVQEGSVPVEILIFPRTAHPVVSPCDKESSSSHCEISLPANQDTFHLTCTVENAKPAVTLEMRRSLEDIPLSTRNSQVESISPFNDNITDKESLRINNTFTTTVSVNVEVATGANYFTCISSSQAHWNKRKPRTLVTIHRQELEPETATTTIYEHSTTDNLTTLPPYNNGNKTAIIILVIVILILFVLLVILGTTIICIKRRRTGAVSAKNPEGAFQSESMLDQPNDYQELEYIPRVHCSKSQEI